MQIMFKSLRCTAFGILDRQQQHAAERVIVSLAGFWALAVATACSKAGGLVWRFTGVADESTCRAPHEVMCTCVIDSA